MISETRYGTTPSGGTRSVIYYMNDNWETAEKVSAIKFQIVEFDAKNNPIRRTYGAIRPPETPPIPSPTVS